MSRTTKTRTEKRAEVLQFRSQPVPPRIVEDDPADVDWSNSLAVHRFIAFGSTATLISLLGQFEVALHDYKVLIEALKGGQGPIRIVNPENVAGALQAVLDTQKMAQLSEDILVEIEERPHNFAAKVGELRAQQLELSRALRVWASGDENPEKKE